MTHSDARNIPAPKNLAFEETCELSENEDRLWFIGICFYVAVNLVEKTSELSSANRDIFS